MTRLNWLKLIFLRYYRSMALRVLLYALLSLVATLISPLVGRFVSAPFGADIAFSSVTPVLTILASSMLAVSTFSLNIMVTAHRAAADTATPRMHRILLEDTTTQSVLAVFIGAFVYSLGSLVLYRLNFYPEDAALVVMGITSLVVVAVILSLLRWITHLTTLGSLQDSLQAAKSRAEAALLAQACHPRFGATALTDDIVLPVSTTAIQAPETGYLQLIDMAMVQACLPDQAALYLEVRPGSHVLQGEVIGHVSGSLEAARIGKLTRALTIGATRTHEQDAEFGLIVLSEIATKALSPGVNDEGTAIEVVLELKSLLWGFGRQKADGTAATVPNVLMRFPGPSDFVAASFAPIARDCAGNFDVSLKVMESLAALARSEDQALAEAARGFARDVVFYAKRANMPERDLDRLRAAAPQEAD